MVFLFTDIEGSTEKWEKYKDEMERALSRHDAILREEIEKHDRRIIKHTGDGVFAIFEGGDQRGVGILVATQRPKVIPPGPGKYCGPQFAIHGVHLGPAQLQADACGDDAAGRSARRQGENLPAALAQVLLEHGQGTGDYHPSDPTAVNGDGHVLAKWFHDTVSSFAVKRQVQRPRLNASACLALKTSLRPDRGGRQGCLPYSNRLV